MDLPEFDGPLHEISEFAPTIRRLGDDLNQHWL
jgi:hypothetical protein